MNDKEYLRIEHVNKSYETKKNIFPALKDIDLIVKKDEFVSIVGASGCGKSTLLRIICGLDTEYSGNVYLNGKKVIEPNLDCGIVFQEHRLLPWLTVEENIRFALNSQATAEKNELVKKYLALVELSGTEKFYPHQLSGGMAQRISIARALVNQPEILLLDEPLGALDALTRLNMQKEILRVWKQEKTTMMMVTHDIEEAIFLGTRVIVMSPRPGTIKKEFMIPDGVRKCQTDPVFIKLRREIYQEISEL